MSKIKVLTIVTLSLFLSSGLLAKKRRTKRKKKTRGSFALKASTGLILGVTLDDFVIPLKAEVQIPFSKEISMYVSGLYWGYDDSFFAASQFYGVGGAGYHFKINRSAELMIKAGIGLSRFYVDFPTLAGPEGFEDTGSSTNSLFINFDPELRYFLTKKFFVSAEYDYILYFSETNYRSTYLLAGMGAYL